MICLVLFGFGDEEMGLLGDFFSWNISLFGTWWYWAIAVTGFTIHWWIEHMMNDGGGSMRDILTGFYEDLLWAIPGSRKRRGEYIRQILCDYGENSMGSMEGYSHEEIRMNNLYEEVGTKMLPGPLAFWGRLVGWIFWPIAGILLLSVIACSWIIHGILVFSFGSHRTLELYDKVFNFLGATLKRSASR